MWRFLLLPALLTALAVSPASAKKPDHGKGKGKEKIHAAAAQSPTRFGDVEIGLIRTYYSEHPASLPPGLQKKLAQTGTLPPGWQKKMAPFPVSLESRFPPPCGYCGRGVMDGYGIIYDKRTRIILDVVQLVADIVR